MAFTGAKEATDKTD